MSLSSPHDNLCAKKIVIILHRKGYFMTKSQLLDYYLYYTDPFFSEIFHILTWVLWNVSYLGNACL